MKAKNISTVVAKLMVLVAFAMFAYPKVMLGNSTMIKLEPPLFKILLVAFQEFKQELPYMKNYPYLELDLKDINSYAVDIEKTKDGYRVVFIPNVRPYIIIDIYAIYLIDSTSYQVIKKEISK